MCVLEWLSRISKWGIKHDWACWYWKKINKSTTMMVPFLRHGDLPTGTVLHLLKSDSLYCIFDLITVTVNVMLGLVSVIAYVLTVTLLTNSEQKQKTFPLWTISQTAAPLKLHVFTFSFWERISHASLCQWIVCVKFIRNSTFVKTCDFPCSCNYCQICWHSKLIPTYWPILIPLAGVNHGFVLFFTALHCYLQHCVDEVLKQTSYNSRRTKLW